MFADIASIFSDGNLWAFVKEQLNSNQFSQGAIVAGIVMGIIAWGKSIPGKIWHFFKKLTTIDMRYNSDSPDYPTISRYVTNEIIRDTFSRNFVFQTETKFDNDSWREVAGRRALTAGYGTHFGIYKRRPVLVHRYMDEGNNTEKFKEHTVITFLTRSKKTVFKFSQDLARAAGANIDAFENVPVQINDGRYWQKMGNLPLRRMTSVFTADDAGQKAVDAIRSFEAKKDEHHALGLPHHLGIMLKSEPGCGKSSLIHAIATETERSILYLNLGSIENDKELAGLVNGNRDWSRTILAVEDIDATGVKVNRDEDDEPGKKKKNGKPAKAKRDSEKSPISLSALLNTFDGILCPDGLVVIATTNHHERLDPALIRPGRFDLTIELGKLGHREFVKMAKMFNRNPADFKVANDAKMTGAEMRALLVEAA